MRPDVRFLSVSELAEVNPSKSASGLPRDAEVSFIAMQDVSESGKWMNRQTRSLGDVLSGFTSFLEGDVLFAKITPCMENGKGAHAVGLDNGVGFGSTEFHVLRAGSEAEGRFLYHWCQSPRLRKKAEAFMIGSAGQQRVQPEFFANFAVPPLPLPEQRRIAEILDTLDEAIRKTEQIISKLQKMKQGLLHDLLTRGIDDNGELRDPARHPQQFKDSPMGQISTEWDVSLLLELYSEPSRSGLYKPSIYHGKGPLMVQMGGIFRGEDVDFIDASRVQVSPMELATYGLQVGDLLFGRRSLVLEGAGKVALVRALPEASTFESSIVRVRVDSKRLDPQFATIVLSSPDSYLQRRKFIRQVAVSGVSSADIGQFPVVVPPLGEQQRIVRVASQFRQRIDDEERKVRKLRALRHGLMDDLLTGRVRVRVPEEAAA